MLPQLHALDWAVFGLVLIFTFLAIVYGELLHRKQKKEGAGNSVLELMLMGRQLTLPLFAATLVATWYGGIFGVAKIAYESGIYNLVTQGIFWYITYLIFAFFVFKKIKHHKAVTLPDLLTRMVGPRAGKIAAYFNLLNLVPISYCISLGHLFQLTLGLDMVTGTLTGVAIVLGYGMYGGFRADVFSDFVQFCVMMSSIVLVLVFSVWTHGLEPLTTLPAHYYEITGNQSMWEVVMWGCLALATLINPTFYQRAFAAKTDQVVTRGIVISTLFWFVFDVSLTFGAMYARSIMPDAGAAYGYFQYAIDLMPVGLKGFFLAGVLATILSTMDSYLFMAGTTITYDLLPPRWGLRKYSSEVAILFVAVVAVSMSFIFDGNIKLVWKTMGSLMTAGMLVPVMACYIHPRFCRDNLFTLSCALGGLVTGAWTLLGMEGSTGLDALYPGAFSALAVLLIARVTVLR